jgi:hypothetical protein
MLKFLLLYIINLVIAYYFADLTFEEEFKIQQLVVMRENMFYKTFEHFTKMPRYTCTY